MILAILFSLLMAALLVTYTPKSKAERLALIITGLAFVLSSLGAFLPYRPEVLYGFQINAATYLLTTVISFISLIIQAYSLRHFDGHHRQRLTVRYFLALTLSLLIFVSADHMLILVASLGVSNVLLARLVTHQPSWQAARTSGHIVLQHLVTASILLLAVSLFIYSTQGHLSLIQLRQAWTPTPWLPVAAILLVLSAFMQSAIWPFHRWLIASANAPTPVSAFMHAGLVNGGALILYKWYPVMAGLPWTLSLATVLGALTALIGTTWMLVQSDVKRTLTCSTMGQMGFMIMQCGLGLFPAAIAHMIWHGFFKASLFLSAGSTVKAARNRSLKLEGRATLPVFTYGMLLGLAGTGIFWWFTQKTGSLDTTYLMLLVFCGITCAHAVMTILQPAPSIGRALLAGGLGLLGATVYGASVFLVEQQLPQFTPLPMRLIHWVTLALFLTGWLLMIFRGYLPGSIASSWLVRIYVRALRSSQPQSSTMTLHRGLYRL